MTTFVTKLLDPFIVRKLTHFSGSLHCKPFHLLPVSLDLILRSDDFTNVSEVLSLLHEATCDLHTRRNLRSTHSKSRDSLDRFNELANTCASSETPGYKYLTLNHVIITSLFSCIYYNQENSYLPTSEQDDQLYRPALYSSYSTLYTCLPSTSYPEEEETCTTKLGYSASSLQETIYFSSS